MGRTSSRRVGTEILILHNFSLWLSLLSFVVISRSRTSFSALLPAGLLHDWALWGTWDIESFQTLPRPGAASRPPRVTVGHAQRHVSDTITVETPQRQTGLVAGKRILFSGIVWQANSASHVPACEPLFSSLSWSAREYIHRSSLSLRS
jgi:hypothetical protein